MRFVNEIAARRGSVAAAAALCLVLAASGRAQGLRADYERAASLRQTLQGKVVGDRVQVSWLPGDRAAVTVNAASKSESWILDLKSGRRERNGKDTPDDTGGIPARSPAGVTRSREGGDEIQVRFENRTAAAVRLFWLDPEGARREYATLEPGQNHQQRTFAGHAWLVTTPAGEPLAAFQPEAGGTAVVTGRVAGNQSAQRSRGPGGGTPPGGTSPDGRWTATIREHNLWLRSSGGAEKPLTTDGTAARMLEGPLVWSPDSRRLVAFRTVPAQEHKVHLVESSPRDQLQPRLRTLDYLKPGDRIAERKPCLFQVETATETPVPCDLFPTPWSVSQLRWSRDSSRFTFLYNQRGHQVLRVVSVDGATGRPAALIEERSPTFIDYAHKTFLSFIEDSGEIVWMSERDGWNHLYLFDANTGGLKRQLTRGPWVVREVERLDVEARQVWFWAGGFDKNQDPYYRHLCRVNLDGTGLVDLTPGDGTHTVIFSPDRRYLVDTFSRVDLPPVTELRRASDGRRVATLSEASDAELRKTGWRPPERFSAPGRDGKTEIHGVIWRPLNVERGRKYPVIEHIYAGPQGAFVPKAFAAYHSQRALAELGFILVQIDGMGTNWRSKAFHDVCWKNLADAGFPDRKLWLQAAARKHPEMDLTRVGIYGGSAGGQNALAGLLHHGDFYKVGVSDCGCHDNRMDKIWWNELWMGWPVGPEYAASSNVTHAHKLQGRVMLVVGELDTNVDPASTMQVVNALVKADRDFDLLVVPGGGHGSGESPYGQRRRADYFVRHLLGVEPRREETPAAEAGEKPRSPRR